MVRQTLQLREHESREFALSADEARDLAGAPSTFVQVSLSAHGRHEVRAKNYVGTIVLPSLNLLIQPKIEIRDLFFLLSYAQRVRWAPEAFPYAPTEDLFASLVWFFDAEMERARVFGLARDYVQIQNTLPTIRGRIDIAEQLRRRQLRPYPLECRFDEYTEDTPLNRVLKQAHAVALAVPGLDLNVASRLRDRHRRLFASVESDAASQDVQTGVHFNRLTAHWQPAFWLAELLLAYRSLRDEQGEVVGRAFTVRMDRVFEHFVQMVVTEELERAGFEVVAQMPVALTGSARVIATDSQLPGVAMIPDLVVMRNGSPVAVADAKYRRTDDVGDFRQPDVYQLFAYCAALGVPRGLLIYADPQPHTTQRVTLPASGAHIDIDAIGIDLSTRWRTVLGQARDAAKALEAIADHA